MRKWLLVVEAQSDAQVLRTICDAVLVDSLDWADGNLDSLRKYVGLDDAQPFTTWASLLNLAKRHQLRVQGKFGKGHAGSAATDLRRIQQLVARRVIEIDAAITHRDTDGHPERAKSAGSERDRIEAETSSVCICLALPDPEMEAWKVAVFQPESAEERERLANLGKDLGFDPTREPQRLLAGAENDAASGRPIKRNAKNVFRALYGTTIDPRIEKWLGHVAVLKARGQNCGLSVFVEDVEQRLPSQLRARDETT